MVKDTNDKFISTAEIVKSHEFGFWSEDIHHDIIWRG